MDEGGERRRKSPTKLTPLGVIGVFVTLTEAVLGFAVTKVTGIPQAVLIGFVIVFALLVFGTFAATLWCKPEVFYPPSEYGVTDPLRFAEAMMRRSAVPPEILEKLQKADSTPNDPDAQFELVDSFLDIADRQLLLLMSDKGIELPYDDSSPIQFDVIWEKTGGWSVGKRTGRKLYRSLGNSGMLMLSPVTGKLSLTARGRDFARWLDEHDRRADFLETPYGGWGDPEVRAAWKDRLKTRAPKPESNSRRDAQESPPGLAPPSEQR